MTHLPDSLLVFGLDGGIYALDAALVRRTLWLPDLSPAPEAPPGIIGRFNLHGEIVPVTDLALQLGQKPHRLRASDQLIVLDLDSTPLAVVVGEVQDLAYPHPNQLLPTPQIPESPSERLITGTLQLEDHLVALLDARRLTQPAGQGKQLSDEGLQLPASPEDQALIRARTQVLREPITAEESSGIVLAVVALGEQYFGIDLKAVREFCPVPLMAPLPCCPPHIAGVFNLRGTLVTLLEISSAFDLPPPASPRPKAVIGSIDGGAVGVAVDEVIDVVTPRATDLRPVPASFVQKHGVEVSSITEFAERKVLVLDLDGLLNLDRWVVDESIA